MVCGWRSFLVASAIAIMGSLIILNAYSEIFPAKELLCGLLLVFFNAFIGTFIANKVLTHRYTGFLVWGMLINGFRIGIFLVLLLVIFKTNLLNNREFAAITLFGYLVFLGREVYTLHTQSLRVFQNEQK